MAKEQDLPEPKGGPFERQRVFFEERFTPLQLKRGRKKQIDDPDVSPKEPSVKPSVATRSLTRNMPQASSQASHSSQPISPNFRQKLIHQYRKRQQHNTQKHSTQTHSTQTPNTSPAPAVVARSAVDLPSADPNAKPVNNWIPIGPSVLRKAQGGTKPATSGRTVGISIAPGGKRLYVATANGGIWRSQDSGKSWRSLMDAFDLNPLHLGADSLACGAVALVAGKTAEDDVIYVGSGEGGGGSYFGVGPLISRDGGANWETEPVKSGSPMLAGSAFYALAVDPADSNRVVAATKKGIYRREPGGSIGDVINDGNEESDENNGFHWAKKQLPNARYMWASSVVVTRANQATTFFAASWGGLIYSSEEGHRWTQVGSQIPSAQRVSLAVQPANADSVYAFVSSGHVYRFDLNDSNDALDEVPDDTTENDSNTQEWVKITGTPVVDELIGSQGNYDLSIAVDPDNSNRIYLGGSTVNSSGEWSGALYRCEITDNHAESTYIGDSVHADIHSIVFTPDENEKMWVGCDGGVYYTDQATTGDFEMFRACNTGLATMLVNSLGQHPTEDSVLFAGTQDNGGQRFTGEEAWLYSSAGDSGYFVVNWKDPYKILTTYTRRHVLQSTDGGTRHSYRGVSVPIDAGESVLFYAPIAGAPYNPEHPEEADIVAFGSERVWISNEFGRQWKSIPYNNLSRDSLGDRIKSLQFASATMLYAGTMSGRVYRFDQKDNGSWKRTRIDNKGNENKLPLKGVVTDIAIDTSNSTGYYLYVSFGGHGDYRHVWHYNGSKWEARSGAGDTDADGEDSGEDESESAEGSLLDVQLNSIVVDPAKPKNLYVAADIGIWHSQDAGKTWDVFSQGLPDAAVTDLKLHHKSRLLRASTYGRGVFERTLDDAPRQGVDLYIRTTQLDQGRQTTVGSQPDPTLKGSMTRHWRSPDIQLDTPDINGNYKLNLENITTDADGAAVSGTEVDVATDTGIDTNNDSAVALESTQDVDFLQFVDAFAKDPGQYVEAQPFANTSDSRSTNNKPTHIYVQVHNRGVVAADDVKVTCLLVQSSVGLPLLFEGYATNISEGNFIEPFEAYPGELSALGTVTLHDIRVGFPKVARFSFAPDQMPLPANPFENNHHSIIAIVHHKDDPFDATDINTDTLTQKDRKVAQKNQRIVQFASPLLFPPPIVVPLCLHGNDPLDTSLETEESGEQISTSNLVIKLNKYEGRVRLYVPTSETTTIIPGEAGEVTVGQDFEDLKRWANKQSIAINKLTESFQRYWARERLDYVVEALSNPEMYTLKEDEVSLNVSIASGQYQMVFLLLDRPKNSWIGNQHNIELLQLDGKTKEVIGGMDLCVQITEPVTDDDHSVVETGKAFQGVIEANSKKEWVSDEWEASMHMVWTVIPLTQQEAQQLTDQLADQDSGLEGQSQEQSMDQSDSSGSPGHPEISWVTRVERTQEDKLVYKIEIINHSTPSVEVEIRYAILGDSEEEIFG